MSLPLRVCIDARIADGPYDGVGSVVRSLVATLNRLDEGPDEFYFLGYRDSHEWLYEYVRDRKKILLGPLRPKDSIMRSLGRKVPALKSMLGLVPPSKEVPVSDGAIEKAGIDVIHFTMPEAFLTTIASVYQPHDLQHLHLPGFFTRRTRIGRERRYRAFCRQADCVVAMTLSGKADLLEHYDLPEQKIAVVPWAPTFENLIPSETELRDTLKKFALNDHYALYPAHTWPHKNHIKLLDAIAILRDRDGLNVPLVCVGHQDEFFKEIRRHISARALDSQVRFLGFVSSDVLRCLFYASRCLVFPSKFEGWGLPIMEAFQHKTPVVCSNISPLREQVCDAALLCDPDNAYDMADAIGRLWNDESLRRTLVIRGQERVALFSWDRTVRSFRAIYRKIGNRSLSDEDHSLLSAAPPV